MGLNDTETALRLAARLEAAAKAPGDYAWGFLATPAAVLRLAAALREAAALLADPPELVRHAVEKFTDQGGGHDAGSCAACRWLARRRELLGE